MVFRRKYSKHEAMEDRGGGGHRGLVQKQISTKKMIKKSRRENSSVNERKKGILLSLKLSEFLKLS